MRAIVIIHGAPEDPTLAERYITPLLPVVDRPFLRYVVASLIASGVDAFDFLLFGHAEQAEAHLREEVPERLFARFHRAASEKSLYGLLARLSGADESVLVAHADRLPSAELTLVSAQSAERFAPILLCSREGWLGWVVLPGVMLTEATLVTDENTFEMWLRSRPRHAVVMPDPYLDVRSFAGLLTAQRRVAREEFPDRCFHPGCPTLARIESDPGDENRILIRPGAYVHPTARLIGPVYVGENSHIGEGAQIGPNAVLGANVLVGERATIKDALLLPAASVGGGLELADAVADRGRVWQVRTSTRPEAPNIYLPTRTVEEPQPRRSFLSSRGAAIVCLLFLWPLLLLTALALLVFRRGPLTFRHAVLTLPTTLDERDWREESFLTFAPAAKSLSGLRHFLLHFLPGLIAVAQGKLRFVGVQPRSREATLGLPMAFRTMYLRGKPGLVHDIRIGRDDVRTEPSEPSEPSEPRLAESLYLATASVRTDLGVLWRYLRGKVR
ncbi:MAG: NDP-sugar synthase [Capsulimonadales bacterium]|nr:NDP-sugar synthase [Capsulimonadales bacterium]